MNKLQKIEAFKNLLAIYLQAPIDTLDDAYKSLLAEISPEVFPPQFEQIVIQTTMLFVEHLGNYNRLKITGGDATDVVKIIQDDKGLILNLINQFYSES